MIDFIYHTSDTYRRSTNIKGHNLYVYVSAVFDEGAGPKQLIR